MLFVQHYRDGGSITGLLDLVRGLDPARYRPVVTFRDPNAFVAEFEAIGVPVVILGGSDPEDPAEPGPPPPAGRRRRPWRREIRRLVRRDLPHARALRAVMREHRVDLVHANNDVASNRDAIVAAALGRRPVVVHMRWLPDYHEPSRRKIDRLLARRVDRLICMSHAIERASAPLGVPATRRLVLDDPFDTSDYRRPASPAVRASLGLADGDRAVVLLARIIPWKGQDVLLRALPAVLADHPDAVAVLVGEATDDKGRRYRAELEALVAELGIGGRVRFAGARRDVADVLAAAEVVVHCSTTPEPFGRVVVEAMAAGRPVIAADAGGVPEIVDAERTGLLVAPGDPEALAAAVGRLLDDPEATAELGRRAGEAVAARFTIDGPALAVQALYDELLGVPAGP